MKEKRGEFSSRLGFIIAATGSAVGLGNVWGFPTNTASNGGAAFVVTYFFLAFLLAYPALMAELVIGRCTRANIYSALENISATPLSRWSGRCIGAYAIAVATAILSFYSLVAGWMLAHLLASASELAGNTAVQNWLERASLARNLLCAGVFSILTVTVVSHGVQRGIERWSERLMPALLLLLIVLIIYVLQQPGAMTGLSLYLLPDFSEVFHPSLLLSALGQAFFSLSLGVGTMLIYGSYVRREDNLPALGAWVTLVDTSVAFLAGLLIIPALFVAQELGITIYRDGSLIAGPDLIFQVLPTLFDSMGANGTVVALAFFLLMTIAALTSSISMLEVPVALIAEKTPLSRVTASWLAGSLVFGASAGIAANFDTLFSLVVTLTTEYSQPLLGIALCMFAGWVLHRDRLLAEIRAGFDGVEQSLFWKIWPFYVRVICPLLIGAAFLQSIIQ